MNIYSVNSNNNNISMRANPWTWVKKNAKNAGQKLMDKIPNVTTNEGKKSINKWNKINDFISHPMWNRGIMGLFAIITQPAIDYYNHKVDDETRTVSRNRTIAKIIAGTTIGMAVRGSVSLAIKKMTNIKGTSKLSKLLLPKDTKKLNNLVKNMQELANYRSTIAMVVALLVMLYTNFKFDAPLTSYLTNRYNKKSGVAAHDNSDKRESEVRHE